MILGLILAAINSWNWLWAQDWSSLGLWHRLSAENWVEDWWFSDNFYAVAFITLVALVLLVAAVQWATRRKTNPEQTQPEESAILVAARQTSPEQAQPEEPAIQLATLFQRFPESGPCPVCSIPGSLSYIYVLEPYDSPSFRACLICANCHECLKTFNPTMDEWARCKHASVEIPKSLTPAMSKVPKSQSIARPDSRLPS